MKHGSTFDAIENEVNYRSKGSGASFPPSPPYTMNQIHKAAGILIRDRKLLVEKSTGKDYFKSPGGKLEPGETPKQALIRELMEEFSISVLEEDLVEFGTFTAEAAGHADKLVVMYVFIVNNWLGEPAASNEVEKIMWINSTITEDTKVGSVFKHQVIPILKEQNLID